MVDNPNQIPLSLSGQQMRISNRIAKAYSSNKIRTIQDLFYATYGTYLMDDGRIAKDAPVITSTTGARNIIYGAGLMAQVLVGANSFGALPKKPWSKTGYRAITAADTTDLGLAENGAIPATTKPTMAAVDVTVRLLPASFDMSSTQMKLSGKDDVVTWEELQAYEQQEYKNKLNRALHVNMGTLTGPSGDGTGMQSLDRVCGSAAENTAMSYTTGDEDIYGLDRTTASWADAYVGHASTVDRYLALSHIDTMLQNVEPYWNEGSRQNKVCITGYDTALRIGQLLQSQLRYTKERVTMTVNGIKTAPGVDAGFEVASYDGIPIIRDSNVNKDTISRIYMLDLDHVWIGMLQPITYLESEDYQAIDKFGREGVYYMEGELVCDLFKAQGKVMDLK